MPRTLLGAVEPAEKGSRGSSLLLGCGSAVPCPSQQPQAEAEARLDVGFQPQQAPHALHVLVQGGPAGDLLGALGGEPAPPAVPQPLPLVPACGSTQRALSSPQHPAPALTGNQAPG